MLTPHDLARIRYYRRHHLHATAVRYLWSACARSLGRPVSLAQVQALYVRLAA